MKEIWSLEQELLQAAGISGRCERIIDVLEAMAGDHCDELNRTPGGVLIAHIRGEGEKLMLWADVHSEGFFVIGHDAHGYTRVEASGMRTMDLADTPLRTEDGRSAVLRMDMKYGDRISDATPLFLDMGKNEKELSVGTYLVYAAKVKRLMNGRRVMAPFCESHVPCGILMQLMEYAMENRGSKDLYFVFADGVQNAASAAFVIRPDCVVTVMAVNTTDGHQTPKQSAVRLGGGPALKLRDAYGPCSHEMRTRLEKAAERAGFALQYDIDNNTNAGFADLQFQNTGIPTAAVALPVRYKNAPAEIYDTGDAEEIASLLRCVCREEVR